MRKSWVHKGCRIAPVKGGGYTIWQDGREVGYAMSPSGAERIAEDCSRHQQKDPAP